MDTFNPILDSTNPTLIFGTVVIDTDEVQDVFDTKRKKMVRRRVRGSKTTRTYANIGTNRKIGGGNLGNPL